MLVIGASINVRTLKHKPVYWRVGASIAKLGRQGRSFAFILFYFIILFFRILAGITRRAVALTAEMEERSPSRARILPCLKKKKLRDCSQCK